MADLPYMNSTGLITTILNKIIDAQTPPKYTHDFQSTVLGHGSGSAKSFLTLLKRIGFLEADGTPTKLYIEFRNSSTRAQAMSEALKFGFSSLFKLNDYAYRLDDNKLREAIIQVTGLKKNDQIIGYVLSSFKNLNSFANFENNINKNVQEIEQIKIPYYPPKDSENENSINQSNRSTMQLSYTINLNLPATTDVAVFNAIFKSLKEHLLR